MRLRHVCAAVLVLMVVAGCAAAPSPSGAICRFTPSDAPGDGLGGTGVGSDVLLRLVDAVDRGIGGTGVIAQSDDRGIGGTGIIGVVTGFASICVNGYDVAVTESTAVSVEGLPATASDIKLGQVVEVEAFMTGGKYAAASVNVRVAVAGPVDALAGDKSSFTVAGQTVSVADFGGSAPAEALTAGQWVAVSGLRRADDVIVGTSIITLPQAGREILVAGPVRVGPDGRRRIGTLVIENQTFENGATVVARGTATADALVASTATLETGPVFATRVSQISVQAYAADIDTGLVRLGSVTVTREALTTALRADFAGRLVQVDGRFGADRIFTSERFILPERPIDGRIVSPERPPPTSFAPGTSGDGRSVAPERIGTPSTGPERPPAFGPPSIDRPERPVRPGSFQRPEVPQRPETPRRN